jgi:hypothetical protein
MAHFDITQSETAALLEDPVGSMLTLASIGEPVGGGSSKDNEVTRLQASLYAAFL